MRALPLAIAAAAMLVSPLPAQAKPAKPPAWVPAARMWEHELSDLLPDPKIHFGTCKNGLRYAWVASTNPKKHLLLRLHVNVGSLAELDHEQGIAHFVEHMAFNGTKNFKAGELIPFFQGQGIKFGQDVNAHTSFEETVYELALPDNEPERLKKALLWFRDVANDLKLETREIDGEKGVIDAEQRDRDGEGFRRFVELITLGCDGTLHPKRLPIGVQEVRKKFNNKICRDFYKRWYRPENMTFLLVGDLGEEDPTALIEKTFGTIPAPKEPPSARPDLGKPSLKNRFFTQPDAGSEYVELHLGKLRPAEDQADSAQARQGEIPLLFACNALEKRLDDMKEKPFTNANAAPGISFDVGNVFDGLSVTLHCKKEKWRDTLIVAEREIRRAVERGFTDEEASAVYIEFDKSRLRPMPISPPPPSEYYLGLLHRACNERYVPMEDRAGKDVLRPAARTAKKEALQKALKTAWDAGELLICGLGGIDLKDAAAETFQEVWKEAAASSLDAPAPLTPDLTAKSDAPAAQKEGEPKEGDTNPAAGPKEGEPKPEVVKGDPKKFAYALPDATAETAEVKKFDDMRVQHIVFKNGVTANVKYIPDLGGMFRFEVRVGEGLLALAPAEADIGWVASNTFLPCGTAKSEWKDIHAYLASKGAFFGLDFDVAGDALVFSPGFFPRGDLKAVFEAICAYLTEPGWKQEGFDEWTKGLDKRLEAEDKPTVGNAREKFNRAIYNGDKRFLPPDKAFVESLTLEDVKNFLAPQLDGPIQITIVGDVFIEKSLRALHSTFGKLPPRRAAVAAAAGGRNPVVLKTGVKERQTVESDAKSALVHVLFPGPDALDAARERQLDLLGDIVDDRLRVEIREKRGGAYSPNASAWGSDCYPGLGFVTLDVQVDPAKVDAMAKACVETMENLGKTGIKPDELDRLRKARLGDPAKMAKGLDFWCRELRRAHRAPPLYEELRDLSKWYEPVTVEQLNALAKQIFAKDKGSVLVAVPRQ